MDRYAVMGHPISHSRSPDIHRRFALQTGQALLYEAIHVRPGCFVQAVETFVGQGGSGLNVTLPFKTEAFQLAKRCSPRAGLAQSVNTLVIGEEGLFGDNTDGIGLIRDLTGRCGVRLERSRVLLLGAGGAARGVLGPLLEERVASIVIANRTVSRAEILACQFKDERVAACALGALPETRFDLIINSTSASLEGEALCLPESLIGAETVCYDMMYGAKASGFARWATRQGSRSFDGLGMLVEQAAESFRLWRGVLPDTQPVLTWLREQMG